MTAEVVRTKLLKEGVFVTGFGFPVVPEGAARIRVQLSSELERADLVTALAAFERVGRDLGVIGPRATSSEPGVTAATNR